MTEVLGKFQPLRNKNDALLMAMERLRQALAADVPGRECAWGETVGDALAQLEQGLRAHVEASEAPDGLPTEVDQTRPTLARQTDKVCQDQDQLLEQIAALRKEVAAVTSAFEPAAGVPAQARTAVVPDFGALRQHAEQLLADLQQNREAEANLILDSVDTDIGVGD